MTGKRIKTETRIDSSCLGLRFDPWWIDKILTSNGYNTYDKVKVIIEPLEPEKKSEEREV